MTVIDGTVDAGFEPVREAFEANFARGEEVGAAVSVYRHGKPVVDLWGGRADPVTGDPWRRDTLQVIYSATKSATALCAHLLVQCGRLGLDTPVAEYWPEFAAAGKDRIPVRWLLSHQAGLPVVDRPLPVADALAWEPMVRALAAQRPVWEPGTRHGYHALTFGWLVGEVVRRVSGRSLGAFFAEEVAEPLGLDFWIGLPAAESSRVSRMTDYQGTAGVAEVDPASLPAEARELLAAYRDPASLSVRAMTVTTEPLDLDDPATRRAELPAVNGVCTARSLARCYAAMIGEVDGVRLLTPDTLAAAITEQASGIDEVLRTPTRPALGFGLPLPTVPWYGPRAFGFPGYGGSLGYADPDSGIAFGYVANCRHIGLRADARAGNLVRALRRALRTVSDGGVPGGGVPGGGAQADGGTRAGGDPVSSSR